MSKGQDTKLEILATGLDMASRVGLEDVTIGSLAKAMNMSKSGLFAHFNSKENLQIEILNYAADFFTREVLMPTLQVSRGVPRIRAMVDNWIKWGSRLSGGCIFVSASAEFSDRPGKVRTVLIEQQNQWMESLRRLARSAIKSGDFKPDCDCDQFAYDLYSLMLGFHYSNRLLQEPQIHHRAEKSLNHLNPNL